MTNTMHNLIVLIPVLTVILSITLLGRSTRVSMLLGSGSALLIAALRGIPISESLPAAFHLLLETVIDNWSLFLSLLVFGMFVYTITRSNAVIGLRSVIQRNIHTRLGFTFCVIASVLLFSADDYLDSIIVGMALTACASSYGITARRFSLMVNMLVASSCTLFVSTWQPVISGSIASCGLSDVRWQIYAFYPVISVLFVIGYAYNTRNISGEASIADSENNPEEDNSRISLTALMLSAVSLILSFGIFTFLDFDNALLYASVIALAITVVYYRYYEIIDPETLFSAWREGIACMESLDITLITIWVFTGLMTSLLHMDQLIVSILSSLAVPVWFLPAIYFVASAAFSFLTSSAFASFRIMIPLAGACISLIGNDPQLTAMLIGAAISGSLFASLALTSDTLVLATQSCGCSLSEAFVLQCRYTVMILIIGFVSYAFAGYLVYYYSVTSALIGSFSIIALAVSITSRYLSEDRER